jgi:hypothetical protein
MLDLLTLILSSLSIEDRHNAVELLFKIEAR